MVAKAQQIIIHEFTVTTVVGWVHKGDRCSATISDLSYVPIYVLIIPNSSSRALWQLPADTFSGKAGETQ
jgi:hypothetical protein